MVLKNKYDSEEIMEVNKKNFWNLMKMKSQPPRTYDI
jgi:hypothetical protein